MECKHAAKIEDDDVVGIISLVLVNPGTSRHGQTLRPLPRQIPRLGIGRVGWDFLS